MDSHRRQRILAAAQNLLDHYGFSKTTVSEIARAAEVGVGTVYLEFPSKDQIIAELSMHSHRELLAAMRREAERAAPYPSRLRALLEARVRGFHELVARGQHSVELVRCRCAEVHRVHERFRQAELALLHQLLVAGVAAGELRSAQPEQTARAVLRFYDSFCPFNPTAPPADTLWDELASAHALILDGLLPR